MNKIYKVIWSKVRNCYVAVSEIAKRNGKSCTSVNCGGKANRRCVALSLALALSVTGGAVFTMPQVAMADDIVITSGSETINDATHAEDNYYLNGSNITFTVTAGGVVNSISGHDDAAVSGNTVTINGGTVNHADTGWTETSPGSGNWVGKPNLTGGFSTSGAVIGNQVSITNATLSGSYPTAYGGYSQTGNVSKNTVIIESNNSNLYVYGGHSITGTVGGDDAADGNVVTMKSGAVNYIAGGWSGSNEDGGSVKNNQVTVEDGTVGSQIYGGASDGGSVELNRVIFEKGSTFEIFGGQSGGKDALNNTVTINDGTVTNNVYGGQANTGWRTSACGDAKGNKVTINGGTISGVVYGGYSVSGTAGGVSEDEGNKVKISGGTVSGSLYGGYSGGTGSATYNSIEIVNTSLNYSASNIWARGGYVSGTGDASFNKVTISGKGASATSTIGAGNVAGGYSTSGKAYGNTVSILDGAVVGAQIFGGWGQTAGGDTKEKGNKVIIKDSCVTTTIYGGYVRNSSGNVSHNAVTVSGKMADRDYTSYQSIYGGYVDSGIGNATANRVEITDAVVRGDVYGGSVYNYGTGEAGGDTKETGNEVVVTNSKVGRVYGGYSPRGTAANYNTVTVSGKMEGETYTASGVYGGQSYDGHTSFNEVTVKEAILSGDATGGYTTKGNANENIVALTDSTVRSAIGGRTEEGTANTNIVTINGGTVNQRVYGGNTKSGVANNNIVTLNNTSVGAEVFGGYSYESEANNNTVNIKGTTSFREIYGSYDDGTGNELHVGGEKGSTTSSSDNIWSNGTDNTAKYIGNFDAIVLHDVAWSTTVPVIGATGEGSVDAVFGVGALDITNIKIHGTINSGESMSLLKSGNNDISSIKLKYNAGEAVSLVNNPVTIGGGAYTDKVIVEGLLKFSGTSADTVSLASDNKAIVYTAGENAVTGATFNGTADWNTSAALYSNSSYNFDESATTSLAGLKFSDTTVTEDPIGKSMTLISGNVKGTVSAQPTDASIDVSLAKNNTTLGGKATGEGTISDGNLTYTINKVALDSVAVTAAGDTADVLPTGWTKGSAVMVDTGTTALDRATGTTILTSETEGLFTGATFSGVNDYNDATNNKHAFASDTDKGVTLDGTQQKGIKASDDGKNLVYAVNDTKDVATITLGTVKTKDPRDVSGTSFDFGNTAKVDAANLQLEIDQPVNIATAVIPLVTNAANLAAGVAVDYGDSKTSHSQDVSFTHDGTGIGVNATVNGLVATAAGAVNYTVTGAALNSVDLSNWNGTSVTGSLPSVVTGSGVAVSTGSFAAPTDLAAGSARDIVTASTGFFTDDAITGANKYGNGGTFTETEQAGVTLAGHKVGGVKADADGAKLTYYAMNKTGDTLTLGEAKFVANGTVAKYGSEYDLTAAAINADGLKFTEGQDAMKAGAVMTVVDATGAVKSGGASLVEFAGKTYEVDFTDAIDNTVLTLTGKHTDTLTQDEGKTKLTYTVGDKNVDTATFDGTVAFSNGAVHYTADNGYKFNNATKVDAANLVFKEITAAIAAGDAMTLLSAEGLTADNAVTQPTAGSIAVAYKDQGVAFNAAASGEVKAETGAVKYEVIGVALNTTDLAGWNGSAAASVPTGWTLASGATIETDGMTAPDVEAGNHVDIVKSDADSFFASATINGANKYKAVSFNEKDGGITFKGSQSNGVTLNEEKNHIIYAAGTKDVATATVTGTIAWDTGKVYYENTKYTFGDTSKTDISGVKFTSDTDPMNQSMTLITNAAGTVTDGSPEFTVALSNTTLSATAEGNAAIDGGSLKYTVTGVTLDKVTVNEVGNDAVPEGWSVASDVAVDTDSMTVPTDVAAGEEKTILTANEANTFSEENISGSNAYKESEFKESSEKTSGSSKGVTITGAQGKGVTVGDEGKSLVYKVGKKEADTISIGAVEWQKGATLLDGSDAAYDYSKIAALGTEGFDVAYGDGEPETVAAGDSMTLLKANETLKDMAEQAKAKDYSFTPVEGVTVNATLTGNLAAKGGAVTYTATENKASLLTFGDVEWKNSGALMTRPSNIIFAGADVDISKINFYKEMYLEADRTMTLVSDFGDSVGTITGSKYLVGTAFEGEGEASLSGSDLIFTTKTEAGVSEQTHKAVMAAEANMALLKTGNEYVGKVLEGLSDIANMGKDGISTMAAIGGGASRYETGSHVNTRTWNAAVAVGRKNETKKGTVEYGIFGEYGKGNYTLHSDVGRSDGDAHYAGGGLMAKFTNKHDVYTEASFRLGRMSDSADDLLRDGAGNAYGYDIHANYFGAHIGVGKVFKYDKGKSLDVYGKYFYTKRDGAEFDALQHYNLDSVKSSILRIGARYGTTNKLWNWYGGLAYEYEFDGEAEGTIRSGGGAITAIRAASVKGSSVRGELGLRMEASKTNPWQTDINLYGYGGKHRGFGGNVSVAYMF